EPGQLVAAMTGADLVCADAFDGDLVAEQVRATGAHGVLWTAEPLRRALKYLVETPNLNHVLGRKDFESPPRAWEVVMIARRPASSMPAIARRRSRSMRTSVRPSCSAPMARGSGCACAIRSAGSSAGTSWTGSRAGSPAARWIRAMEGQASG